MDGLTFTRWERLCMLLAFCLIGCLCVPGVKLISQLDRPDYTGVPHLTYEQLEPKLRQLRAELDAPVGSSPRDYFLATKKARELEPAIMRFHREGIESRQRLGQYGFAWGTQNATIDLQGRYVERFGWPAMAEAAELYSDPDAVNRTMAKTLPVDWGSVWSTFARFYALSCFVAVAFFAARVKGNGMRLIYELPAILFYSTAWVIKVWQYPTYVSPLEQFRRVRRWIAMLISTTLSFAPLVAAKAAERRADGAQTTDGSNVLVIEDVPKPRFSVGAGVMSRKIAGNGFVVADGPVAYASASADLGNGLTAGYWRSRELAGTGASDEIDYTLTWAKSDLLAGIAYYDIRPLHKSEGGDMIAPYAKVGRDVGSGLRAALYGEAYFLTHGHGNDGYLVSASLAGSRDFRNATVDQSVALVYSKGPFRQEEGIVLRFDTNLNVPLSDQVKGVLALKAFAPLVGAKDRRPGASLTGGLAVAF